MILITHIILAFLTIGLMVGAIAGRIITKRDYDTLAKLSGACFAGLFISGTALVILYHASILGACLEGILYFGVLSILYFVYKKLATNQQ